MKLQDVLDHFSNLKENELWSRMSDCQIQLGGVNAQVAVKEGRKQTHPF